MSVSHPRTKLFMVDHWRNDVAMPASVVSSPIGIREHSCIKIDVARLVVWTWWYFRSIALVFHVTPDECFQTISQLPSLTRFRPTAIFPQKIKVIANARIFGSSAARYDLSHKRRACGVLCSTTRWH